MQHVACVRCTAARCVRALYRWGWSSGPERRTRGSRQGEQTCSMRAACCARPNGAASMPCKCCVKASFLNPHPLLQTSLVQRQRAKPPLAHMGCRLQCLLRALPPTLTPGLLTAGTGASPPLAPQWRCPRSRSPPCSRPSWSPRPRQRRGGRPSWRGSAEGGRSRAAAA